MWINLESKRWVGRVPVREPMISWPKVGETEIGKSF